MRTNKKVITQLMRELADGLGVSVMEAGTYRLRIEQSLRAALGGAAGPSVQVTPNIGNAWTVLMVEASGVSGLVFQTTTYTTVAELLDERHTTLIPRLRARLQNRPRVAV